MHWQIVGDFIVCRLDRSENGDADSTQSGGEQTTTGKRSRCSRCCLPCLSLLCLPCVKLGSCCRRGAKKPKEDEAETAAEPAAAAKAKPKAGLCSCCRRSRSDSDTEPEEAAEAAAVTAATTMPAAKEPGKCALCLSKFLCCRRTNQVVQEQAAAAADDGGAGTPARRKCCWCIPCGPKQPPNEAWADRRESILSEPDKRYETAQFNTRDHNISNHMPFAADAAVASAIACCAAVAASCRRVVAPA